MRFVWKRAVLLTLAFCWFIAADSHAHQEYPAVFEDAQGNKVALEGKPKRICSVTLGTDENLLDLVSPDRIVCMTKISKDDYISNTAGRIPEEMLLVEKPEDLPRILEAKPDLVLAATYNKEGLLNALAENNLPVYVFSEFGTFSAIRANFETLGRLVGEEKKAAEILKTMDRKKNEASKKDWAGSYRAVFYSEGYLFGGNTVFSEIVESAGLIDSAKEFGLEGGVKATPKLMANLKPDFVFVAQDTKEAENETLNLFRSAEFKSVPAIHTGNVYAVPGKHVTTVSRHIIEAVNDIQAFVESKR